MAVKKQPRFPVFGFAFSLQKKKTERERERGLLKNFSRKIKMLSDVPIVLPSLSRQSD